MDVSSPRIAVVGRGRLGTALAAALRNAGLEVSGPLGRGADPMDADVVLLCVPDGQIASAAAAVTVRRNQLVGHCSGATPLAPIGAHEAFGLHPLMTIPTSGAVFEGATAAIAGSTPRALDVARRIATSLGMSPVTVEDADRAVYHASCSVASNFLLTLEDLAERLAASAGVPRERLVPLVRATVANWAATGAGPALTGPVARGDEVTIARQRAAVAERSPEDLDLFDHLVMATRRLAAREDHT